MKILSDIYKQESGLELVTCCEKLELKSGDLSSLTTPVILTTVPHYSDTCYVYFYPVVKQHITSLVCLGFDLFYKYIKEFNSFVKSIGDDTNRCDGLESAFEDAFNSEKFNNNLGVIDSSNLVIEILKNNREELNSFIDCLKQYRPVELTKGYNTNFFKENSIDRFYVSHLMVMSSEVNVRKVLDYSDVYNLAPVNLERLKYKEDNQEYIDVLKSNVSKVEAFDLSLVILELINVLGVKKSYDLFSLNYDLIYLLFEKWGI